MYDCHHLGHHATLLSQKSARQLFARQKNIQRGQRNRLEKLGYKGIIDNYFDTLLDCRGRYIADCAGDDFWIDPLKLEKEVNILEQHPEVTLVHTAFNYFDYNKKQIIKKSKTIFNNKITYG